MSGEMCSQAETRLRLLRERAVVFFHFSIPRALTPAAQPARRASLMIQPADTVTRAGIGCSGMVRS